MKTATSIPGSPRVFAVVVVTGLLVSACGNDQSAGGDATVLTASNAPPQGNVAPAPAGFGNGTAPDTRSMGAMILEKINGNPAVEGKATLVEFGQKSIDSRPLGDKMVSAVVEFEGVVTFSSDVQWSWQGPTKADAPQKFEARAEFVNQGKGWELIPPLGIYPL